MKLAVIGVGSNLGARKELIARARALVDQIPETRITKAAPIYETKAVGPEQPDYLNTAWRVETRLDAYDLFKHMLRIEHDLGRAERSAATRWMPRTIDLDLLWIEGDALQSDTLRVPHPELTKRAFALAPLLDVMPELRCQYQSFLDAEGGPPQRVCADN